MAHESALVAVTVRKVLVIDNQRSCLKIQSRLLGANGFEVTECERHEEALKLLRETKFDVVVSSVTVPETDMDGFKLLELVGLEMDLPVILILNDLRRETVIKLIKHGACDFLVKPMKLNDVEIVREIVAEWKKNTVPDPESSGSLEKSNNTKIPTKTENGTGNALRTRKKKKEPAREDDENLENGEESKKKQRFNWNGEHHRQFVSAVKQLGGISSNNAKPKKILEVLSIPGLCRTHVASHLQKFKLGLKKAEDKQGLQTQRASSSFGVLNRVVGPTSAFSFQTLPPRPVTLNNHAPNITPLHNMSPIDSSTIVPGFQEDSQNMLWSVVASHQSPMHQTNMNPLLMNQNYSLRNMQHGYIDTLTMKSNSLVGNQSGTSQHPSFASTNRGFDNNNFNGLSGSGTGFVQNNYSQALIGIDRIESPSSNLTGGNSEAVVNPNPWDLDYQM